MCHSLPCSTRGFRGEPPRPGWVCWGRAALWALPAEPHGNGVSFTGAWSLEPGFAFPVCCTLHSHAVGREGKDGRRFSQPGGEVWMGAGSLSAAGSTNAAAFVEHSSCAKRSANIVKAQMLISQPLVQLLSNRSSPGALLPAPVLLGTAGVARGVPAMPPRCSPPCPGPHQQLQDQDLPTGCSQGLTPLVFPSGLHLWCHHHQSPHLTTFRLPAGNGHYQNSLERSLPCH